MSRGPQMEKVVTRLVRLLLDAGLRIRSIEVDKFEKITVVIGEGTGAADLSAEDDLDRELAEFVETRHGQG